MFPDINYLASIWWQWMAAMFWQASLFILIISAIDILTRRWVWPQLRYALWLLILVKLVVPPTWSLSTSIVSHINQPFIESIFFGGQNSEINLETKTKRQPDNLNSAVRNMAQTAYPFVGPSSPEPQEAGLNQTWKIYVFVIWVAGMLVFFSLLIMKMFKLRKWHQQYKENEKIPAWFNELLVDTCNRIGLMSLPAIVFSDKAVTPAVYGLLDLFYFFPQII